MNIKANTLQFLIVMVALLWVAWPVGDPQQAKPQKSLKKHVSDLSIMQTKVEALSKTIYEVKRSQINAETQRENIFNGVQDLNIKLDAIMQESKRELDRIASVLSKNSILKSTALIRSLSKQLAIKKEETHEYLRRLEIQLTTIGTTHTSASPAPLPKKKLTPTEKISKLNSLAHTFTANYEGHNPKAKRRWNIVWETAIEDGGAPNSIANNKLISVLMGMQGKEKGNIK